MTQAIDYATHPNFNPDAELTATYEKAIQRLQAAFSKDEGDKSPLLAEASEVLEQFSPERCRDKYGLGSRYSLAKEFHFETFTASAASIARILEQQGKADEALEFLLGLYRRTFDAGFVRASEFLANRIDSRTFMPMRKHIDAGYLRSIGYTHPDSVLLCVGDCQTVIMAEKARDGLKLDGIDIASYQHALGSLIDSPLNDLFHPAGYLFFVNCAADYALIGKSFDQREKFLDIPRKIVAWLQDKQPKVSVFVTHVFFGVDKAEKNNGSPREVSMDAATKFSDDAAAIFAAAPNARLINFQEICPFTPGDEAFRDRADSYHNLHFRFDVMDAVSQRVNAALSVLEA